MIHTDEAYDIYMAKKDNGKPKNDYPSKNCWVDNVLDFEVKMPLKLAKVK